MTDYAMFEVGKTYKMHGRALVTIEKRTSKTLTVTVFNGYLGTRKIARWGKQWRDFECGGVVCEVLNVKIHNRTFTTFSDWAVNGA